MRLCKVLETLRFVIFQNQKNFISHKIQCENCTTEQVNCTYTLGIPTDKKARYRYMYDVCIQNKKMP